MNKLIILLQNENLDFTFKKTALHGGRTDDDTRYFPFFLIFDGLWLYHLFVVHHVIHVNNTTLFAASHTDYPFAPLLSSIFSF